MEARKRKVWLLIVIALVAICLFCVAEVRRIDADLVMTASTHDRIEWLEVPDEVFGVPIVKALFDPDSKQLQIVFKRVDDHLNLALSKGQNGERVWHAKARQTVLWMRFVSYLFPLESLDDDLYLFNGSEEVLFYKA
ncbi:MAG: hypothetical protein RR893_03495 [Clostridia bacterium]